MTFKDVKNRFPESCYLKLSDDFENYHWRTAYTDIEKNEYKRIFSTHKRLKYIFSKEGAAPSISLPFLILLFFFISAECLAQFINYVEGERVLEITNDQWYVTVGLYLFLWFMTHWIMVDFHFMNLKEKIRELEWNTFKKNIEEAAAKEAKV